MTLDLGRAARDPWVLGQVAMILAVLIGAPLLGGAMHAPRSAARIMAGGLVLALGLGIAVRGVTDLGRNLTPATEPHPDGTLVTTGIYRMVRHPIYLGMALMLTGWTLAASAWWAALLVLAIALGYFEGKARVEEGWMTRRFADYASYRGRVPRIVPFGWK